MERKFTDGEIVKALNCCGSGNCRGCPYWDYQCHGGDRVIRDAIDLINRQKAEIERLTEHNKILMDRVGNLVYECDCAKQEAIKGFAERLKKYWKAQMDVSTNQHQDEIVLGNIDNLVKEMTGENNGN